MRKGIIPPSWFWIVFYSGIFLFTGSASIAQKIFFEQLTSAEGLPSDYVNTIFEDSKGFLWIGTDKGACRYKDKQFVYFNKDNGLPSNFINCISEDPKGNIWFGTFEGGLCKYDGQQFRSYPLANENEFRNIFEILFNKDGSFFLESGNFNLYFFRYENAAPERIGTKSASFISSLGNDQFLVSSTNNSIFYLEKKGYHLSIQEIWHTNKKNELLLAKPLHGRFVTQEEDGINVYETRGKTVFLLRKIKLAEIPPEGYEKIFYSKGKEMWISSYSGLSYVDKLDQLHFFAVEKELGGNYVNNIYEDSKENVYICTFGGGIKIWPRFYLQEFPLEGKVISIFPYLGATYLTTTKQVYKYIPEKKIEIFKNLSFENFSSFYASPMAGYCLGTYKSFFRLPTEQSLYSLNGNTRRRFEVFTHIGISGFLQKSSDQLFVSMYGGGIYEFDSGNRIMDSFNMKNKRLVSGMVEFLKPLSQSMAVLTYGSGLTLIDNKGRTVLIGKKEGLLSNSVYAVYQDPGNQIWIGTLDGVNLYDGKRIVKTYSNKEGLVGSKVICIFRDPKKRLWVLSDKYLHLVEDSGLRAIRSHPVLFEPNNSINRAAYDTATGNLYIGLTNAFLIVDVNRIVPDSVIHAPGLSAFVADDSSLAWKDKAIYVQPGFNKLAFQFASQGFSITQKSDIYYKLAGYGDQWSLLDNSGELDYAKLPPGKYNLLAKTTNPDGYASPAVSLVKFEILPPFWRRPGFVVSVSTVLLFLVFLLGKKYSRTQYEKKIRQMQETVQLQVERERIARELHDNVGSQLTYLINKIEDEHNILADKTEAEKLGNFARSTMRELRETIWALNKKEILPEELAGKVRQLLKLYKNHSVQIELDWQNENSEDRPMKSLEALNIFRIVQEAMNNAVKYSHASCITVRLINGIKRLEIMIVDNGKGFNVEEVEKGYGLLNMQKRAEEMSAKLNIESSEGCGTKLHLSMNT
jgi:ligand-binding sensor domain-containing protein/two-component sensor histidine kinase